jgi:RimJ/RimL family protein N-acetyltransferase
MTNPRIRPFLLAEGVAGSSAFGDGIISPEEINRFAMSDIRLEPMTKDDYSEYQADNIKRYALEGVASGRWEVEESLKESEKSIKELLPRGIRTKNNFFFNIVAVRSKTKIGVLWLAIQDKTMNKSVFIFDILVFEKFRNEGLGTETLKEIDRWARGVGADAIWLHAFWHNQQAVKLYRRLGFLESGVTMVKRVGVE